MNSEESTGDKDGYVRIRMANNWFTIMQGDIFEGSGVIQYPDGAIYKGSWQNLMRHGFGIQKIPNGAYCLGDWKEDKMTGVGLQVWGHGGCYEGGFVNHCKCGRGVARHYDGSVYVGNWDKLENGYGEYYWLDGSHYKGEWCDGKKQGKGEMTFSDGSHYQGEWSEDYPHGKGVMHSVFHGHVFEGEYDKGVRKRGTVKWSNGDVWGGEFLQGRTATGTLTVAATGEVICGEWADLASMTTKNKRMVDQSSQDLCLS
eukprot:TRINITY_DN2604_c0_g2_i1.p1 TRINITY_DN2604_c0_g2~~TRINITY_DN2604_c0_g2_i1.p1  ORF type:complete len:257 (+),score=53.36 TRINITY_DN2604_c0_g2_i1:428-1198(+)